MNITIENVSKEYKNEYVLRNITLTLQSGKVYGLYGKNGSGKTMLMRMICGLIRPTTGRICIDGKELGKNISFPNSVGALIENPGFIESFSGYNNLKMLADIKRIIGKKEIEEVLKHVNLYDQKNKKVRKYSLGMKKKLGIAAAIMENPELVLLDEPMNALDKNSMECVRKIINHLKAQNKLIIIASHDLNDLNNISDEIIKLELGEIVEE